MLKILKSDINKVENYYRQKNKSGPLGYRVSIPVGEKGSQNTPPHFYVRLVPKYKKGKGTVAVPINMKLGPDPDFVEHQKKFQTTFQQLNDGGLVAEKTKVIAKFHNDAGLFPTHTNEKPVGLLSISTKNHLPNDINAIDEKT